MKSRRKFLLQGGLASTAFMFAKPLASIAKGHFFVQNKLAFGNNITILHTANLHHTEGIFEANSVYQGLGGVSNIASKIASIKNEAANTLLLDSGNSFHSDGVYFKPIIKAGYDAMLLGSHNIEKEELGNLVELGLPVLHEKSKPYFIIKKGNIRVGVITTSNNNSFFDNNNFEAVNALAESLSKDASCNLVVCLSSLGYKNKNAVDDIDLAASSQYIDIIIGNDPDVFLKTPTVAQNKEKQEVYINNVGKAGIVLGKLEVSFDENGKKKFVHFDNLMIGTENNRWRALTA
jgi:5'-nucleotidase